jgi:hypothetical protein
VADGPNLETDGIEIFATGTTSIATGADEFDAHDVGELLRRSGAWLHDGYDHIRELQARPGRCPGVTACGQRSRRRGEADVVRPVAVSPGIASAAAVSGALFDGAIPHLCVEHDERDRVSTEYLVWQSTVTHRRRRGVPATLHLLASPSMVVTVLELVPQRNVRWHRRRFISDGIAALDAIAARLEVSAATRAVPRRARSTDAASAG